MTFPIRLGKLCLYLLINRKCRILRFTVEKWIFTYIFVFRVNKRILVLLKYHFSHPYDFALLNKKILVLLSYDLIFIARTVIRAVKIALGQKTHHFVFVKVDVAIVALVLFVKDIVCTFLAH